MRSYLSINYWRWLFAALLFFLILQFVPSDDFLALILEFAVSYFLSGYLYRWFKRMFFRPILLFDLHGVIIAGDMQLENAYERSGTRNLIRRLRKRHFVAALTNFSPELFDFYARKFGLTGEFDAIYSSGMYGVKKPEQKIFGIVLADLGVRSKDVIFFDDNEANVSAARKLGIRAIRFENARQAEKALNSLGICTG